MQSPTMRPWLVRPIRKRQPPRLSRSARPRRPAPAARRQRWAGGRDLSRVILHSGLRPCKVMRLAERFAERSAAGMLTRAAGAWLLVGLPVIAARIWWSPTGAIGVFAVCVTVYVVAARRYMDRMGREP
jgi:hypothetical protein